MSHALSPQETVCAVVVTHERRELLGECLAAVAAQSRPPDHVLVIDNASTDGTAGMVAAEHPEAELLVLDRNEGGAGGFHEGMRRALAGGWTWLWLMDDDTVPQPDCLERLLEGPSDAAVLAPKVVWTDGRIHPMNPPRLVVEDTDALVDGFERGAVPLRWCTFPGSLVRAAAAQRHGLPRKEFFIWSDDIDFTARVLRHEPGFFVPAGVAVHKTRSAAAPWAGGARFYYAVRNSLWLLRGDALRPKERAFQVLLLAGQVQRHLSHEGWSRRALATVARGLFDGLR